MGEVVCGVEGWQGSWDSSPKGGCLEAGCTGQSRYSCVAGSVGQGGGWMLYTQVLCTRARGFVNISGSLCLPSLFSLL